jgi:hypothetical protein
MTIHEIPWGTVIIFALFCFVGVLAFAEGLSRQKTMQQDITTIRDAIHSVARKSVDRIAYLEGQVDHLHATCPLQDRRSPDKDRRNKSPDDWLVDSNFNGQIDKSEK